MSRPSADWIDVVDKRVADTTGPNGLHAHDLSLCSAPATTVGS